MKRGVVIAMGILAAAALLGMPGCGDDDDPSTGSGQADVDSDDDSDDDTQSPDDDTGDGTGEPADYTIPEFPFWPNGALSVEPPRITATATDYCATQPAPDAVDFTLRVLPLAGMDDLCADANHSAPPLGDLYLSGYFGGLWLRDSLDGVFKDADAKGFDTLRPFFNVLVSIITGTRNIWNADEAAIEDAIQTRLPLFLILYGYNRGYLDQILENPPEGVTPYAPVECGDGVFDCVFPAYDAAFIDRFSDVLPLLADPPDARWQQMADLVPLAESAVDQGRAVWTAIPLDNLDDDGYRRLVDLSGIFLAAARAVVLGHMRAWADESIDDAHCSLPIDAGMISWAWSYFMGLASPSPPGTFPTLACPE